MTRRLIASLAAAAAAVTLIACDSESEPSGAPWTAIESSLAEVRAASVRGGHVQIRVGSVHDHGRGRISVQPQ